MATEPRTLREPGTADWIYGGGMSEFVDADLSGASFERVSLHDAAFPLRECLFIVVNEEYEHRRFAERDLAALQASD